MLRGHDIGLSRLDSFAFLFSNHGLKLPISSGFPLPFPSCLLVAPTTTDRIAIRRLVSYYRWASEFQPNPTIRIANPQGT